MLVKTQRPVENVPVHMYIASHRVRMKLCCSLRVSVWNHIFVGSKSNPFPNVLLALQNQFLMKCGEERNEDFFHFIVPHASVQPFGDPLEENRDSISFCSTWLKRRHRLFLINNGMVMPSGGSKQYSSQSLKHHTKCRTCYWEHRLLQLTDLRRLIWDSTLFWRRHSWSPLLYV